MGIEFFNFFPVEIWSQKTMGGGMERGYVSV